MMMNGIDLFKELEFEVFEGIDIIFIVNYEDLKDVYFYIVVVLMFVSE